MTKRSLSDLNLSDATPYRRARTTRPIPLLLFAVCLLASGAAVAERMYQWLDPATGTMQLAGAPPAWYVNGAAGPRVRVFENGRVIEDTARQTSRPAGAHMPMKPPPQPEQTPAKPPIAVQRADYEAILKAWDDAQSARAPPPPEIAR